MTTEQEYRERRTALANMLRARPERHDQSVWGDSKPENECGTVGCAAGWAKLAKAGIVTIAPDGEMTWDEDAMIRDWDGQRTLWRSDGGDNAFREGQEWLGLGSEVANYLFDQTVSLLDPEEVAVEMLQRLGDGRLGAAEMSNSQWVSFLRDIDHPDADYELEVAE